ncbi:MAG: hypothetical protein WC001_10740 [Desulfurivibrionaceae bacterium]
MTLCKPHLVFFASLGLLFLFSGCARTSAQVQAEDLLPVKTILVLPAEVDANGQGSRSPNDLQQLEKGRKLLDTMLAEHFSGRKEVTLLTEGQRDSLDKDMTRCRTTAAVTICRTTKADAVLLFTLQRFTEREGIESSIVSPASVAFDYKLIHAETGRTLCSGVFDETQKPLLDDMFQFFKKLKRGVKWLSAEELASDGFQQKIADCPNLEK